MNGGAFVPLSSLSPPVALVAPATEMRVALVCMPWGSIEKPSVAMGILKRLVADAGFTPELHYLNFTLAAQIGLKPYEEIAGNAFFHQEWFFSQLLFGAAGTGELRNGWDDLVADPRAESLRSKLDGGSAEKAAYFKYLAEVELPRFVDAAFAQVDWSRYTVVGFTTTFAQSLASLVLAKRIKAAHPGVSLVFGGANVDAEMGNEFMRGFPWLDHAVHGEAEYTFPALLRAIARSDGVIRIPGISSRNGEVIYDGHLVEGESVDMNKSPSPDYSDYVASIEKNGFKGAFKLRLFFESSRGCWWGAKHHCTFCGLNGSTMAFRYKEPARALQEVLDLSRDYQCLSLSATDNILSNQYWKSFLPQLAERNIDLALFYEVKANLTFEQLELLKLAGVREIQPGIESFSTAVLKLMNKGVTGIQNIQLLKWCFELGIRPIWNILYGFPGETDADYAALPDVIRSISHLYPPGDIAHLLFERFSPYHYNREKYGLTLQPSQEYQYIYPKNRVAMDRIAYFFEDVDVRNGEVSSRRAADLLTETRAWQKSWESQERYCFYEKGAGFVHLYDNRPRTAGEAENSRLLKLGGHLAEVYLFCNGIRSRRNILATFGDGGDPESKHNRSLVRALEALTAQKLLHAEDDRYIALAVRKKSRQFWPDKY